MSPEERQLLTDLFDRVRGAAGSPRDREAEDLIAQKLRDQPYAAYFLAQAVIIQDQALKATTDRLQELEDHVQQLESHSNARQPENTGFLSGLGSLFGNRSQEPAPRSYDNTSQRDYTQRDGRLYDDYRQSNREPEPGPGPWGRAGAAGPWSQQPSAFGSSSGFLSGALTTAAGVAGGVLAADAIRGIFSSHVGGTANPGNGLFGANGNQPVEENTTNNYFLADNKSDSKSDTKPDSGAGGDSAQGSGGDSNNNNDDDDNDDYDTADYDDGGGDDSFA